MKTIYLFISIIIISFKFAESQTGITIYPSAVLNITGDVFLNVTGNQNFINHSNQNQFGGTVVFSGISEQMITGNEPSVFANIEIDKDNVLTLGNDITITDEIILTSGILNINEYNLTLEENALITGNFSSDNMINTDGAGVVSQHISETGNYLFPIGDMTSGNDYSPVEIDFISGTFNNATVSVQLKNAKHPQNTSSSDYINRYWTISSNGITDFNADIDLNYPVSDLTGLEDHVFGGLWNSGTWQLLNQSTGQHITGSISAFGDFTGGEENTFSGIDEFDLENINISFNGGNLYIRYTGNERYSQVNIYSMTGQTVHCSKIAVQKVITLPFSASKGLYIVELISEKNKVRKKFLKN
jgi:hypothetical protein